MELLLQSGAEVNAQGGPLGNALQVALHGGYERVVRLLLDWGAANESEEKHDDEFSENE